MTSMSFASMSTGMGMGIQDAHSGAGAASSFTLPNILCCECGVSIQSNPSNMCMNCLKSKVDITDGISKQVTLFFCRGCERYQRPPWVKVELESREMLALCLQKIKGLNKDVKLVDAHFIWTEPHSRRIRVKLTVQKEVFNAAILQQAFEVEFVVTNQQCTDCQKSYTEHVWKAVVQVRQKVKHKRTIFYLEQLMLKHGVCDKVMYIKEMPGGLDFFWSSRSHALAMIDFLRSVVPIRVRTAKRLISADLNSNIQNFKYTFFAEIAPTCRDDLVILEPRLQNQLGGVSPLMLVARVTSSLTCIDPITLKLIEISGGTYWHHPFPTAMYAKQMIEYVVLDIEKLESMETQGRHDATDMRAFNKQSIALNSKICLAKVVVAKASDMGKNDEQMECLTHLGHVLKAGDSVLGFDVRNANLSDVDLKGVMKGRELPEVLLVKKLYQKQNRSKHRVFKLRSLPKEEADKSKKKTEVMQEQQDYEEFLNEIEEDPEMRAKINLYRNSAAPAKATAASAAPNRSSAAASSADMDTSDAKNEAGEGDDDDAPGINVSELLDELDALQMEERRAKARAAAIEEGQKENDADDGGIEYEEGGAEVGEDEQDDGMAVEQDSSSASASSSTAAKTSGKKSNYSHAKKQGSKQSKPRR